MMTDLVSGLVNLRILGAETVAPDLVVHMRKL
jgi:hypothetical protein